MIQICIESMNKKCLFKGVICEDYIFDFLNIFLLSDLKDNEICLWSKSLLLSECGIVMDLQSLSKSTVKRKKSSRDRFLLLRIFGIKVKSLFSG